MNFRQQFLAQLCEAGQDEFVKILEDYTQFDEWPEDMKIEYDMIVYGTGFKYQGKRVDPTEMAIFTRAGKWWCPECKQPRKNSICDGKFDHNDATHQQAVRCFYLREET